MRSRSDFSGGFLSYLARDGRARWIVVLLLLGLLLLVVGFLLDGRESRADAVPTREEEIAALLSSVDGVGECVITVVYSSEVEGEVVGVAVVCEGAESADTKQRVISMLSTLFHIGTHRITVEKLSK